LDLYRFVGKVLGMALRGEIVLDLNFPSTIWKKFVDIPLTLVDFEAIDQSVCSLLTVKNMLKSPENKIDSETLETLLANAGANGNFTYRLSGGYTMELIPNGLQKKITSENCYEWVQAATKARLHEADRQIEAIMDGLGAIIPLDLFKIFTNVEIDHLICGSPRYEVENLRSITVYESGLKESTEVVRLLWDVLEDMDIEQRTQFLRFVWARSRMPPKSNIKENFKIAPLPPPKGAKDNANERLPHASTCFFRLMLPKYTEGKALREKLIYAMDNCPNMDLI